MVDTQKPRVDVLAGILEALDAPETVPATPGKVEMATAPTGRMMTYSKVKKDRIGPLQWAVRDLFLRDSVVENHGQPGCYKSFFDVLLAVCIAGGVAMFLGLKVDMFGPVVYIAGEGLQGIRQRLYAAAVYLGLDLDKLPIYLADRSGELVHPDEANAIGDGIAQLLGEVKPALVIVDTLAANYGAGNENATEDMNAFVNSCKKLQQRFGCVVLISHHEAKAESAKGQGRGNGALKAGLDTEVALARVGDVMRMTISKQKEAEAIPPFHAKLIDVDLPGVFDDEGRQVRRGVLVPCDSPAVEELGLGKESRQTLDMLRDGPMTVDVMSKAAGITYDAAKQRLNRLKRGGQVDKVGDTYALKGYQGELDE
ncbi:MAG: AAA family ATPase [bacterium]